MKRKGGRKKLVFFPLKLQEEIQQNDEQILIQKDLILLWQEIKRW
jgi:hypothetical protein